MRTTRHLLPLGLIALLFGCSGGEIIGGIDGGFDAGRECDGVAAQRLDDVFPGHLDSTAATGCVLSGCHATGAGGLKFTNAHELWQATVGKVSTGGAGATLVVPGHPKDSYLFQKLGPSASAQMPLGGPYLDDATRARVAGWICAGALEPALPPTPDGGTDGGTDGGALLSIAGFSPASGVVGTPVVISGTRFDPTVAGNALSFNGTAATVTAATAVALTTSVPAGATTGKLTVTANGATATSALDFQVVVPNPVPSLSSLAPATAVAGGATFNLAATGSGFVALSTLEWDGAAVTTTSQSSTSLSATIPAALAAQPGSHTVTITNPGPGGGTSAGQPFVVTNPVPAIGALVPASVVAGSGALTLTINGSGFNVTSTVSLNGAPATVTLVSPTQLQAPIAATLTASLGGVSVMVTNPAPGGGASGSATLTVGNPMPVSSSLSSSTTAVGSATFTLSVDGTGFLGSSQVQWDGATLVTTFVSGIALTASIDASLTSISGAHVITVFNPAPGGGASNSLGFNVTNPVPAISAISPSSVATNGAPFSLAISGSGFVQNSVASFNGTAVATTFVSGSSLTAQISTIAGAGSYPIVVTNPAPGGGASAPASLTAAFSTSPTITGLSPTQAPSNTAFSLTVTGSGFSCSGMPSQVLFNGVVMTVTSCTSTQLVASIPAQSAGTYPVQVKNLAGGTLSNIVTYAIVAPNPVPTLSSLSPSSAGVGGAAFTLTLNGSSFAAGVVVKFNGAPRVTSWLSASQLTAAVTAADLTTAGSCPVTATNPAPGGGASNALSFTVVSANPIPAISGLSPASVGVGTGSVTITTTGTGFLATSTATFNGASRPATFLSATQLTVALTAADVLTAGRYPIVVTNPAPGGGASNSFSLSVVTQNPAPSLTSLSPTSALAGSGGITLVATGSNFVASSSMIFNGVAKPTTFTSATQLSATISSADLANAATVPVQVMTPTPGGGTTSTVNFQINNPVPAITSISPTTVAVNGGTFSLSVNGSGFVSGSVVQLDGAAQGTSFVNSTQVSASLPSFSATGTHLITVLNGSPGGGTSSSATLTVSAAANPVPVLSTLSPCGKVAGSSAFTLTLTGSAFVSGASITFNGTAVTASYVSATQLTASIPGALIATAPATNAAPVVVTNPGPGGGPSVAVSFGVATKISTLSGNVQSIFTPSCASALCHVTGSATAPMSLQSGSSYGSLVGVTSSACLSTLRVKVCGPLRAESVLVDKIKATAASPACSGTPMPKGMPLTAAEIQTIVDWVAQGAPP